MPHFKVAYVREQAVDLIVVPVESSFGSKTAQDQHNIIEELQLRSRTAGLAGTVVPVWDAGGNRMAFVAPSSLHPFFNNLAMQWVWANINREISW